MEQILQRNHRDDRGTGYVRLRRNDTRNGRKLKMEELRKKTTLYEFNEMLEDTFDVVTKYLIVAREYRQARDFSMVMEIPMKEWKFVETPNDLMGYRDFVIVTLGGMYGKDNMYEIMDAATLMVQKGYAKMIHVEDWR